METSAATAVTNNAARTFFIAFSPYLVMPFLGGRAAVIMTPTTSSAGILPISRAPMHVTGLYVLNEALDGELRASQPPDTSATTPARVTGAAQSRALRSSRQPDHTSQTRATVTAYRLESSSARPEKTSPVTVVASARRAL